MILIYFDASTVKFGPLPAGKDDDSTVTAESDLEILEVKASKTCISEWIWKVNHAYNLKQSSTILQNTRLFQAFHYTHLPAGWFKFWNSNFTTQCALHVWVEILCTWPLQAPLWSAVGTPELRKLSWWIDVQTLSVQVTCFSCANWTLSTIILLCKLLWFPFSTKFLECRSSQVVTYIMIRTPDGPWMEQRRYRLVAITQESSRVGLNESRSEISTSFEEKLSLPTEMIWKMGAWYWTRRSIRKAIESILWFLMRPSWFQECTL